MLESLVLVKFAVSIIAVLGLTLVSERISPKAAGFLSGLPIGTAITLFFYGLQISPGFASDSAIYNLVGHVAFQIFLLAYFATSGFFKKHSLTLAVAISVPAYFAASYLLASIDFGILASVALFLICIPAFALYYKKIPEIKVPKSVAFEPKVIIFRSLVTASYILLTTEIAGAVGPRWAGILSTGSTLFPLVLIVHYTYGKQYAHTVIKHVPAGLGSMLFYSLGVHYAFPSLGVWWGTVVAYLACGVYLVGYYIVSEKNKKTRIE
ncbi:hypothetical protein FJZ26_06030 [Candidatus Parvarchaeota archaeon]|nr:hypothetical protein [Candidatus Parvarchaeota archaeon]